MTVILPRQPDVDHSTTFSRLIAAVGNDSRIKKSHVSIALSVESPAWMRMCLSQWFTPEWKCRVKLKRRERPNDNWWALIIHETELPTPNKRNRRKRHLETSSKVWSQKGAMSRRRTMGNMSVKINKWNNSCSWRNKCTVFSNKRRLLIFYLFTASPYQTCRQLWWHIPG